MRCAAQYIGFKQHRRTRCCFFMLFHDGKGDKAAALNIGKDRMIFRDRGRDAVRISKHFFAYILQKMRAFFYRSVGVILFYNIDVYGKK